MLDASVLSEITDDRLFSVHDGLHSFNDDGQDVSKAFGLVTAEMARRGLVVKALNAYATVPGKSSVASSDTKRGRRALGSAVGQSGTDEEVAEAEDEDDLPPGKAVAKDAAAPDKCSDFTPVRDVCRNCKQPSAAHKEVAKGLGLYRIDKGLLRNVGQKIKAGIDRAEGARANNAVNDLLGGGRSLSVVAGQPPVDPQAEADRLTREEKIKRALNMKSPVDQPGAGGGGGSGRQRGGQPGHPFNGNQYSKADYAAYSKADYSVEQRRAMAEKGQAMADGSFPVANEADLHHAVRLVGQGSDPQAAMQHIIERAKSMGMEEALPEGWLASEAEAANEPKPGAHGMDNEAPAATPSKPAKKSRAARVGEAIAKALGAEFSECEMEGSILPLDDEFSYAVIKAEGEKRRTIGPVYMPDTVDAHGEWASASDLEEATVAYVKSGDRTIYLQHSDVPAGEWYGVMPWPFEEKASMTVVEKGVKKSADTTFPAGTVYMGIEWQPWAWDEIKSGKLTGLSMGGTARRIEAQPAA